MNDLSQIISTAALQTLEKHAPGLADTIRTLRKMGVSPEKITARCKTAGAHGIVLALVEAAVIAERTNLD